MNFNHYFTYEEISSLLQEWQQQFPDLLEVSQIGLSYEKRPIWLVTITNRNSGAAADKPAMWVDANIHAPELAGSTAALKLVYTLVYGYGKDERITRLLDGSAYYIVPRVNPDGAALAMANPPRYIRSGVRAYPFEDKLPGLHDQDIDGDGRLLQMRLRDPNGDWKISSLDPRLMEKRAPDEHGGTYYRIFPEGLIEDYDGYTINVAPAHKGLDFNRNFPFEWRTNAEQDGAGPYPASESEVRALVDFISGHANINIAISLHTYSRVILRPYSTRPDDKMDTDDLWVYQRIARRGSDLSGYRNVSIYEDFLYRPKTVTTGAFDDWMYDHLGVFAFTIELWDLPDEAGIKNRKFIEWFREHPHQDDLTLLKWADENTPGGYVAWYPFTHPQLGEIELGGWNVQYTWGNPPEHMLEAEADRNIPFLLASADMLPCLNVHTLKATALGNNNYHLNLVLENSGFLPTYTSQQGKARKAGREIRVELALAEGMRLIQGKQKTPLGHLEGRSNKLDCTPHESLGNTDNRTHTEWVINAPQGGELRVNILCPRAGNIQRTIKLT